MFLYRSLKVNWIWGVAILLMAGSILAAEELRWLFAGVLALGAILAVLIRLMHKVDLWPR